MITNEDIVVIGPGVWDESALGVHRYTRLLAAHNRVLFVERAITPLSIFILSQRHDTVSQFKQLLKSSVRQVEPNVFACSPLPALPLRFETPIIHFNQWLKQRSIRYAMKKLNFKNPIIWNFSPDSAPFIGNLDEQLAIYSITDDYPTNPLLLNRRSQARLWHNRSAEKSDLVITTASSLADKYRYLNENIHYVPQGVEYELFSKAMTPQPLPEDLVDIPTPRIGFIGRVNVRINIDIIQKIALQHPEWSLVFVGQVDEIKDINALRKLPNVYLLGRKPLDTLPHYLSNIDVGIIPYTITEHTIHMHPLKALEYLAAGKPVVSTSMPTLEGHQEYIDFADDPEAFVNALERILVEDTPQDRKRRNAYAQQYTWKQQLEKICGHIENTRQQK